MSVCKGSPFYYHYKHSVTYYTVTLLYCAMCFKKNMNGGELSILRWLWMNAGSLLSKAYYFLESVIR